MDLWYLFLWIHETGSGPRDPPSAREESDPWVQTGTGVEGGDGTGGGGPMQELQTRGDCGTCMTVRHREGGASLGSPCVERGEAGSRRAPGPCPGHEGTQVGPGSPTGTSGLRSRPGTPTISVLASPGPEGPPVPGVP